MFAFLKQTFKEFSEDSCTRLAAAMAYFTAFALPPLLYILLMVFGLYYRATGEGSKTAQKRIEAQVEQIAGPAADEVKQIIAKAGSQKQNSVWKWAVSIAGVLIGATGLVASLQDTLNETWEVQPDPEQGGIKNFIMKRILSLGMILTIAFVLLVSTIMTFWIAEFVGAAGAVVTAVVSFLVITLLFAAMFKYLPDAVIRWKDVIVGAFVTALLFTAGKFALTVYLSRVDFSQFGAAASLAILLVWVYYSSLILLYGAEFTQVWAKRYGSGIRPEPGAVRVIEKTEKVDASPA